MLQSGTLTSGLLIAIPTHDDQNKIVQVFQIAVYYCKTTHLTKHQLSLNFTHLMFPKNLAD